MSDRLFFFSLSSSLSHACLIIPGICQERGRVNAGVCRGSVLGAGWGLAAALPNGAQGFQFYKFLFGFSRDQGLLRVSQCGMR